MADPFAAGLSALHGTGASVAATYTPPGGDSVALRVVHEQPSETADAEGRDIVMDTHRFTIEASKVALPVSGGTIVLDPDGAAETYRLAGDPMLDTEGLSWLCPAEAAG